MDHLLIKENVLQESDKVDSLPLSKVGRSGPFLLLAAFAIMLFKAAPHYWPLTLTAFLGYAAIKVWEKKGLFLATAALCCICILTLRSSQEHFWVAILSGSIFSAWLLIYLGDQERKAIADERENQVNALVQEQKNLQQQIKEMKRSLSAEREKISALSQTHEKQLTELTHHAHQQHSVLSEEVAAHQQKAANHEQALGSAMEQIAQLQQQLAQRPAPQVEMEESQEEKLQIEQIRYQHALLREQFEEKSELLSQTRKELFQVENEYLSLQKAWEEKQWEAPEEFSAYVHDLKRAEEQTLEMQNQVDVLQEVISSLLLSKKRSPPRKTTRKSIKQKRMPDLF